MSDLYWTICRTRRDMDDAQRLRWQVLAEELNISGSAAPAARDVSIWDNLATSHHVLVRCGQEVIGTARLALMNPEVARISGMRLGLELEQAFDLEALVPIGSELAEIARLCVPRRRRGSGAVLLYEGLYTLSRQLGVRYWLGGVDCQTADAGEAHFMRLCLEQSGFSSRRFSVHRRHGQSPDRQVETPIAVSPDLRLATTLSTFTSRFGAQCVGSPARHPVFARFVMPMLADLDELPATTLAHFDQSVFAPSPPAVANMNAADSFEPALDFVRSAS
jgi:L-ornithine Nalpha-acyltransferase